MLNELRSCAAAALVKAIFGWNAVNGDTGSKTLKGRRKRSAVRAESSRIRPVGARWRQKRFKGRAKEGTAASRACARPGAKGSRRNDATRLRLSPVELGLVCGQEGFVVFFRSVGQEDRRLSHAESRLVQGQQYPGSSASEVFPADKQDRAYRN